MGGSVAEQAQIVRVEIASAELARQRACAIAVAQTLATQNRERPSWATVRQSCAWDHEGMPKGRDQEQQLAYLRALDLYKHPGIHSDFDVIGPVLVEARRELEQLTRLAVDRAVRRGEPWSRIGPSLGVTRQAAQQRYGKPCSAVWASGRLASRRAGLTDLHTGALPRQTPGQPAASCRP